jgi:hypothetical protein
MLRDLLTQKGTQNKKVSDFGFPEHVESENIKFIIGHWSSAYQLKKKKRFLLNKMPLQLAKMDQKLSFYLCYTT